MYLTFNKITGAFAHVSLTGVVFTAPNGVMDDATVQAIERLKIGEYCYIGNSVIVKSCGHGATLDELKTRSEP